MFIRSKISTALITGALLATLFTSPNAFATVDFDWATVGNSGNAADTTGYGAVPYEYRISKHEVTNTQYAEFLNAVDPGGANSLSLYSIEMADRFGGIELQVGNANGSKYVVQAGRGNNPVAHVSWYDSIRFVNWLHNGQGNGDTETGAYTILGGTATPSNGALITRNSGADFFLPSEDEWYKAAYHDASSGTAGDYFLYAMGNNTIPTSDQPSDNPAAANFFANDGISNGFNDGYVSTGGVVQPHITNPFTDVGAYSEAVSPYGTFDQNGNVDEWVDAGNGSVRVQRGGHWAFSFIALQSATRYESNPNVDDDIDGGTTGFRVASTVPEPTSIALLAFAAPLVLYRRKR